MNSIQSNTNSSLTSTVLLIGGGRMGTALVRGWIASGILPEDVSVLDPQPSAELLAIANASGFTVMKALEDHIKPDVVVIAIKPQIAVEALTLVRSVVNSATIVISIMAGTSLSTLRRSLPEAASIIRAMPNLPSSVGRGAVVAVSEAEAIDAERTVARKLLEAAGHFEWLDSENQIDIATGLSGSGPAYVFYLVDCLARSGVALGLHPDVAGRLARATIEGSGELLYRSKQTSEELRKDVTSPRGTTEAGLKILMDGRLQKLMDDAVACAVNRARELSGL